MNTWLNQQPKVRAQKCIVLIEEKTKLPNFVFLMLSFPPQALS